MLFYPSGGIATIGLGASLTVFLCACTNLTLTPALVTLLPGLLGAEKLRERSGRSWIRRRCTCRGTGKCWPRLARVVTKQPGVILMLGSLSSSVPATAMGFCSAWASLSM